MLSFQHLSSNDSLFWTEELIDKCNNWNWDILSTNKSLPWSLNFIKKHQNKLRWKYDYESLSIFYNTGIHWSKSMLDEFKDKLDWRILSQNPNLPWSEDFINSYKDNIAFKEFSLNEGFEWTKEFIDKHKDKLDWELLSINETLPWSEDFIIKYREKWDFDSLLSNTGIIWTSGLIESYREKIDWSILSENIKSNNYDEVLRRYANNFLWFEISNPYINSGVGLSCNYNVFKEYLENLTIESICDIFFLWDYVFYGFIDEDKSKYIRIHMEWWNLIGLYEDADDERENIKPYNPLDDNPYYDSDFDIDQQGPFFDF